MCKASLKDSCGVELGMTDGNPFPTDVIMISSVNRGCSLAMLATSALANVAQSPTGAARGPAYALAAWLNSIDLLHDGLLVI